jgi:hypothetical protein
MVISSPVDFAFIPLEQLARNVPPSFWRDRPAAAGAA